MPRPKVIEAAAEALQRALYSRDPDDRLEMLDRVIQTLTCGAELEHAERLWLLSVLSILRAKGKIPHFAKGRKPRPYKVRLRRWGCLFEALATKPPDEKMVVTIDRAADAAGVSRTVMTDLYQTYLEVSMNSPVFDDSGIPPPRLADDAGRRAPL